MDLYRKNEILEQVMYAEASLDGADVENKAEAIREIAAADLNAERSEISYIERVVDFVLRMRAQGLMSYEIEREYVQFRRIYG